MGGYWRTAFAFINATCCPARSRHRLVAEAHGGRRVQDCDNVTWSEQPGLRANLEARRLSNSCSLERIPLWKLLLKGAPRSRPFSVVEKADVLWEETTICKASVRTASIPDRVRSTHSVSNPIDKHAGSLLRSSTASMNRSSALLQRDGTHLALRVNRIQRIGCHLCLHHSQLQRHRLITGFSTASLG